MDKKEQRNLRVFGYGLAVIAVGITFRLMMKQGFSTGKGLVFLAALALCVVTAARLEAIRPLYRAWMTAARFIGEIVTFVLLTVIFVFLFAVPGLVLRLLKKDLLDQRLDKNATTYWKTVPAEEFDRNSFKNQF